MGEERGLSQKDRLEIGAEEEFEKFHRAAHNSVIAPHLEKRRPEGRYRPIIVKNMVVYKPDRNKASRIIFGLLKAAFTITIILIAACTIFELFGDLENFKNASIDKAINVFNLVTLR